MNKLERIQDLREERFWTQTYVAYKLGIPQRSYAHYENATRAVPLDVLIDIAILYGVSVDYLLDLTDEKKPYPKTKSR